MDQEAPDFKPQQDVTPEAEAAIQETIDNLDELLEGKGTDEDYKKATAESLKKLDELSARQEADKSKDELAN